MKSAIEHEMNEVMNTVSKKIGKKYKELVQELLDEALDALEELCLVNLWSTEIYNVLVMFFKLFCILTL